MQNKLIWKSDNIRNGSYLLSDNGYLWSDSYSPENGVPMHVSSKENDIIKVNINLTKRKIEYFIKENNTNKFKKLIE